MIKTSNSLSAKLSNRSKTIMLALTAIFTALIIAGAFIKIPIPEVPCTMQMFFVQLASSMLGWVWGSCAVALYLFMGLVGIPVFTKGGGPSYVLQPTFGYLIGFLIGSLIGGLVIKAFKKKNYVAYFSGNFVNLLISYACGMLYYFLINEFYFGTNVTAKTIFFSLFLLLIPGDIVFTFLASFTAQKLHPILERMVYQTATDKDIEEFENANTALVQDNTQNHGELEQGALLNNDEKSTDF